MDAMMARVNTDIGRDREAKSSQLIAQGIPPGSEAFQREMEQLDRKQTDARQQAEISAQQQAGLEYQSSLAGAGADFTNANIRNQQAIQEALLNRQTPLNEISAFRTGSQVNMPQFQAYGNQQFTGGPDYLGATTATGQYDIGSSNQDIAQKNALMGGLFGLGSAGIMASDRRLKKNIKRLGTSLMGFPVYAFDYIWGGDRQIGVMAQDIIKVKPEAVITMADGYMAVNYGMIS